MELQAYCNELSVNGTGPNGGIGRVSINLCDRVLKN